MELNNLEGHIIGVVSNKIEKKDYSDLTVEQIVLKKCDDALKMVGLSNDYKNKRFNDLSTRDQNKVILASKLFDSKIVLEDFSKGMINKDLKFYRNLFKKVSLYNRQIIIVDNDINFFLNLVDNIYVINNDSIIYQTNDIYDLNLYKYTDMPKIVQFVYATRQKGIKIDNYTDFDELLKAIFRLKS